MKRKPKIDNVIARDTWRYKRKDGTEIHATIIIGRPRLEKRNKKNSDWACPVFIEGITPKTLKAMGVGSVDSLMNALILVKSFFDMIKDRLTGIGVQKENKAANNPLQPTRLPGRQPRC